VEVACADPMNLSKLCAIAILSVVTVSCGTPGAPLPPSLEVADPVTDLRAARKGNAVTLTWSEPTHTTEQRNITRSETVRICRSLAPMTQCGAPVASVPMGRNPAGKKAGVQLQSYTDNLNAEKYSPVASVFYAVAVANPYGRSAGLSNQVTVPAAPALPAPAEFQAHLEADGVKLSWQAVANPPQNSGLRFVYRIYRREAGSSTDAVAGEVPVAGDAAPTLLDTGFEWEKTYDYRATMVTQVLSAGGSERQIEGDDSQAVSVVAHDIFPPATPNGLQAVFSGPGQKPFIDLVWSPDAEADLAGYNVYRHETGSAAEKINQELIESSAYRDDRVVPGHRYTYSVSAVDARGNESARSEEAAERVPESP